MSKINNVAFIFARGNSQGLPNKNILNFGGLPLIAHTIEFAKKTEFFDDIVVSTDSKIIADIAISHDANVPFVRPSELASNDSAEILSWKHAINFYYNNICNFSHFFSLPVTAPLKNKGDLLRGYQLFKNGCHDLVIAISKSTRSPYFNMVKKINDDVSLYLDSLKLNRRQDAPQAYDISTLFYISTPQYILKTDHIYEGKVGAVEVPQHRAIDIDTLYDYKLANLIFKNISDFDNE